MKLQAQNIVTDRSETIKQLENEYNGLMEKVLHFSNPTLIQKIEGQLLQLEMKIRGLKESTQMPSTKRMDEALLKEVVTLVLNPEEARDKANYHQKRKMI